MILNGFSINYHSTRTNDYLCFMFIVEKKIGLGMVAEDMEAG